MLPVKQWSSSAHAPRVRSHVRPADVRAAVDDRHGQRPALVAERDERAARQRPVGDADQGPSSASGRRPCRCRTGSGRTTRCSPSWRHGFLLTEPAVGAGWAGRTGAGRRLGSQVRLDECRALSRLPADRAPGSWGWIVIAVPRTSAATSTPSKRPGSTVASGAGALEPTGPGTATVARMAMSATLATTFRRRTSVGTLPRIGDRGFRVHSRESPCQIGTARRPTRSTAPLDLRRTLAPLSRGPGDPTIRLAAGPRLAGHPNAPTGRPRVALVQRATELRGRGLGTGRRAGARPRPGPARPRPDRPADPGRAPARRAARPPGAGDPHPAHRRRPRVARARPSSSRRSPARRPVGRGPGSIRAHGEPAPGPPRVADSASRRRRRRSPRSPTTPTTRSASSSAGPTSSGASPRRAAWFEAIVDLPLPEATRG